MPGKGVEPLRTIHPEALKASVSTIPPPRLFLGGANRTRTCDLLCVKETLYQLSHGSRFFVRREGVEPTRPCGHWLLKPARLPFRHRRSGCILSFVLGMI